MPTGFPRSDRLISVVCGQVAENDSLSGIDVVLTAERLGFTDVWVGEAATYDAFALTTALATRTHGLRYTVGPLPVPVRDPVTIARGVASIAVLTNQHVDVALGTSSALIVERWHGRSRERAVGLLIETTEALRPLLRGEKAGFDGELVRTNGYQLKLPAPDSTISLAGFGDLAIRAAARLADRLIINLVTPSAAASIAERLTAAAATAGRPVPAWRPGCPPPSTPRPTRSSCSGGPWSGTSERPGIESCSARPDSARSSNWPGRARDPRRSSRRCRTSSSGWSAPSGPPPRSATTIRAYFEAGVDEVCVLPSIAGDDRAERTLGAVAGLRTDLHAR